MGLNGIIGVAAYLMFISETLTQPNDWSNCPSRCKCKWVSGKKTAECTNAGFTSIPSTLSSEVQNIDLSRNEIRSLSHEAFKSVGLIHLHKIALKECKIKNINRDAFKQLEILIELDLSDNEIHNLHPGTFRYSYRLRLLYMNRNPIQKLDDGLFTNLTFLQTVEMSDCQLAQISMKTFINVTNLQTLMLNGNDLTRMKLAVVEKLTKLRSLVLHRNPWKCDCYLKPLRDWVVEHNLYSQPTSCHDPQSLEGKHWIDIKSDEFACKPVIEYPTKGSSVIADGDDVMLSCRVSGVPLPEVHWVYNSRIISNNTRTKYGDVRYTIRTSSDGVKKWVNVTINRVRPQDKGEFTCVARSHGGVEERNVTLLVKPSGYMTSVTVVDSWPLIIGLAIGMVALLIIVIVLCCCFCRRKDTRSGKKSPVNGVSPNGDISHHIVASEQEKSLLTVNPVQKPPRRYEVQTSPSSGGEMSELKRNLLDDGSTIGNSVIGDEDRSIESIIATPQRSRDMLDNEPYPPDLIAFPGRGHNASPAGSSASAAVESRHAHHFGHQSPLHSPIYNGFGTLPYSRSQSPFSPVTPVVLPRQGYVTIPRRPRIPSWSSAPTPSLLEDPLSPIKAEPVYDNLGPRTTADGSSILSLNKAGLDTNPRRRNNSLISTNYPAYEEKESGILRPLPSPLSPEDRRYWAKRNLDLGILKRSGSAEIPSDIISRPPPPKVAPKPPPKPKSNGPLYEDEGEDGTEV